MSLSSASVQPEAPHSPEPDGPAPGDRASRPRLVDPRGLRFAAAVTAVVLVTALVTENVWILAGQAAVFALGVADRSPYGWVFRRVVRPRLGPPADLEDPRPPRFAQGVGLAFALLGLAGFLAGSQVLGLVATAAALAAAFLNAAFGVCLGCELYLLVRRTIPLHKEVSP